MRPQSLATAQVFRQIPGPEPGAPPVAAQVWLAGQAWVALQNWEHQPPGKPKRWLSKQKSPEPQSVLAAQVLSSAPVGLALAQELLSHTPAQLTPQPPQSLGSSERRRHWLPQAWKPEAQVEPPEPPSLPADTHSCLAGSQT